MIEVKFYDLVDDTLLKFAVIISRSDGILIHNGNILSIAHGVKDHVIRYAYIIMYIWWMITFC